MPKPRRQLGLFDAIMLVMGGIIGAGIFANPSEVAHRVHTPFLILAVWVVGGLIALAGAFIWAELTTRLPGTGGQYLYLREAYHPCVAFVYGWVLLLVTQTGGMAAVAITFAVYFRTLTGVPWSNRVLAAAVLLTLSAINCLGARTGSNLQSALMLLKIGAIATLVAVGLIIGGSPSTMARPLLDQPISFGLWRSIGVALIPVAFTYGGWQTATFVAGEMRDPRRDLSRGLILGVLGVVVLYLAVNFVCLHVLGAEGMDQTSTPASDVMRKVLGESGAQWIAAGIAISTLGFLSQSILTAPRVDYAMACDGVFFAGVGKISRSGAPILAIALQGMAATIIACSGKYGEILNFEVTVDFISFALTASALFVLRRRGTGKESDIHRVPGHPVTTILFVISCLGVVTSAVVSTPRNSGVALAILLAGIPVYWFWRPPRKKQS